MFRTKPGLITVISIKRREDIGKDLNHESFCLTFRVHFTKTLPLIDTPKEISDSYVEIEKRTKDLLDWKDRLTVFGAFGDKDKVVNHKADFTKRYLSDHVFTIQGGEHQIKEEEYKEYIFPIIESIDANCKKVNEIVRNMDAAPFMDWEDD